ncbi:18478_t:CDS:10 [Acaulospora morrowiae]|uniref:18478_t:CDS:1 n=1 Tax=Acaulospora morrowiae TaxID=94023 RepID=A0A9N9ARW6_9GLOM|nr:18478_t:CDS:10 [Acaulospora morrowiae]
MQLTTECLKALKSRESDTPSLHKYLKFQLQEGNLEAEETEHLRYNSDLIIISKYYSESSVINYLAGFVLALGKVSYLLMRGLCRHQLPCWFRTGIGKGFVLVGEHAINCGVLSEVLQILKANEMETQICLEQTYHILDVTRDTREQGLLLRRTITNKFERRVLDDSLNLDKNKKKNLSLSENKESKKVNFTSRDVEDDDFISNNIAEGPTHSKATSSLSGSQSLEMPIETESTGSSRGATEMTSDMNDVNSSGCDIPRTPPHQICSTYKKSKRLRQEKQRVKSTYEPICSNIIVTTWDPFTNEATKYIDELIDNICSKDLSLIIVFEAPRNSLLDKNSEGWLNCHVLTPLIDDCFLTCEEISLASTEQTYVEEDPQNSKPISYKHKILREMKN